MQFSCKSFGQLDTGTLFTIMKGRVDVFVVEQSCPYPELDAHDIASSTQHIFIIKNNQLLSYARCYEKNDDYSAIGRVLVNETSRGKGVANKLVSEAIKCCKTHWPKRDIYIGAQTYLLGFYRSFGFQCIGKEYLEDGIPHQDMILNVT